MPEARVGLDVIARDRATATLKKIGVEGNRSFNSLSSTAQKMQAAIVGSFAMMAAKTVIHSVEMASRHKETADAFERQAKRYGQSAEEIVEAMETASRGTIPQFQMIANASAALRLGVARDVETFDKLMKIATMRGKEFGYSTAESWGFLVRGIGRASPLILDNIGFLIQAAVVNEKYAQSIGKTSKELTLQEERFALVNKILEDGADSLEAWSEATMSAADNIARAAAEVQNLKDELAIGLAPTIGRTAGRLTEFVREGVKGIIFLNRFATLARTTQENFWGIARAALSGREALGEYIISMWGAASGTDASGKALWDWLYAAELATDVAEELTAATDGLSYSMGSLAEAIETGTANMEREYGEFAKRWKTYQTGMIRAGQDYSQTMARINEDLGRDLARSYENHVKRMADLQKDYFKQRAALEVDLGRNLLSINQRATQSRFDQERAFTISMRELLEDQKMARTDFEEDLSAAIYEAAGKRDAITIRRLQRQATRDKRRMNRDHKVAQRRLVQHHRERLAEIERQRQRELNEARRAHAEAMAQLDQQFRERRDELIEQYIQEQIDARIAAQRRREDAARALADRQSDLEIAFRQMEIRTGAFQDVMAEMWFVYYNELIKLDTNWRNAVQRPVDLPTPPWGGGIEEPPTPGGPWPSYHAGGVVPGIPGSRVPIWARGGERYLGSGVANTLTIDVRGAIEVSGSDDLAGQITTSVIGGISRAVRLVVEQRV